MPFVEYIDAGRADMVTVSRIKHREESYCVDFTELSTFRRDDEFAVRLNDQACTFG